MGTDAGRIPGSKRTQNVSVPSKWVKKNWCPRGRPRSIRLWRSVEADHRDDGFPWRFSLYWVHWVLETGRSFDRHHPLPIVFGLCNIWTLPQEEDLPSQLNMAFIANVHAILWYFMSLFVASLHLGNIYSQGPFHLVTTTTNATWSWSRRSADRRGTAVTSRMLSCLVNSSPHKLP